MIYDYEEDTINFCLSKHTEWKGNKRIHLPKSGSASLEAYCEVRRKLASKLYDECMALLKDGEKKGFENLTNKEKQGLQSLQKRVKNSEPSSVSVTKVANLLCSLESNILTQ